MVESYILILSSFGMGVLVATIVPYIFRQAQKNRNEI